MVGDVGESRPGLIGRLSGLMGREKLTELRLSSDSVRIDIGLTALLAPVSTLENLAPLLGVGLVTRSGGGSVLAGRRNVLLVINEGDGEMVRGRLGTGGASGSARTV